MPTFTALDQPRIVPRARIRRDEAREADVLLFPEGVLVLNPSAAAILKLCDGTRTVAAISAALSESAGGVEVTMDVLALLDRLADRNLVEGYAG